MSIMSLMDYLKDQVTKVSAKEEFMWKGKWTYNKMSKPLIKAEEDNEEEIKSNKTNNEKKLNKSTYAWICKKTKGRNK